MIWQISSMGESGNKGIMMCGVKVREAEAKQIWEA